MKWISSHDSFQFFDYAEYIQVCANNRSNQMSISILIASETMIVIGSRNDVKFIISYNFIS